MTRQEHLLIILAEECNELAQQCSKALRFGLDKMRPNGEETNAESIAREFEDLIGVYHMLFEDKCLPEPDPDSIDAKAIKVEKFLEISKELGTLT